MNYHQINYLLLSLALLFVATPVLAIVMSSTNYQIDRDSINFSGGLSTSTSYRSESTLGELGTGPATSTAYVTQAGYQQMEQTWISLTLPLSASLLPNINLAYGGIASTSLAFAVNTNNGAGYTLQLRANSSPALQKTAFNFFNDYTVAGVAPDYTWTVGATTAEFGFTPEGHDIVSRYKDNGASCNQSGGADTADTCWDSTSLSYETIAQSLAPNYPLGATTTLKFRAEAGALSSLVVGTYTADMNVIAYTN